MHLIKIFKAPMKPVFRHQFLTYSGQSAGLKAVDLKTPVLEIGD